VNDELGRSKAGPLSIKKAKEIGCSLGGNRVTFDKQALFDEGNPGLSISSALNPIFSLWTHPVPTSFRSSL
jgi:hypothetical protein